MEKKPLPSLPFDLVYLHLFHELKLILNLLWLNPNPAQLLTFMELHTERLKD